MKLLSIVISYIITSINILKYKIFSGNAIRIHYSTTVSYKAKLNNVNGGVIEVGKYCHIHDFAMLLTYGGNIKIGNKVNINPFCILYGHGGLKIGNYVNIAAHTVIIPANHNFNDTEISIRRQGITAKGIEIRDDVWIGANATVLDGVQIGKGCVIGAGSVVTHSLPPYSVAVGNPARVLYKRGEKPGKVHFDQPLHI